MTSQYNKIALMYAAENNASDVAKLLIDKGSDVNATDKVCYFAAVVPHAMQRHHQWCESRTMFRHCAGRNATCGEHCVHSVHADHAFFVFTHTHDNAH